MEKVVAWAIGILVALVVIGFMWAQLGPGNEGSLTNSTLKKIFSLGP